MSTPSNDSIDTFVHSRLVESLRRALQVAEGELPEQLDALHEALGEARDRASAWQLARLMAAPSAAAQQTAPPIAAPVEPPPPLPTDSPPSAPADAPDFSGLASAARHTAFVLESAAPRDEFLLIPFGRVRVEQPIAGGDFVFTPAHAQQAIRWFERLGRKLAIDYEHQSLGGGARPDGLRPAAGWIGRLETRRDGLWAAQVSWTPRARALLGAGEYRYFSPVIYWSDEDCSRLVALGPVALTNDPAMHGVTPLAAGRGEPGSSPGVERSDVDAEVAVLRARVAVQEAEQFIRQGLELGKIVVSTSEDWREDYLRDPARAARRLERAPVLLPPGRLIAADACGRAAPLPAASEPRSAGCDAEDLAAFERAARAGRVLGLAARVH